MSITAVSSSSQPSVPTGGNSSVQALEAQERSIQKQITALEKNTQLDAQTKAQELSELEDELQQIQMALEQAQQAQQKSQAAKQGAHAAAGQAAGGPGAGAASKTVPDGATTSLYA